MSVFIYKTKGKFPDDFIIEGVDVLLMAKGSAAEVGYITDESLISDLCDLNYEEYSRGLHHSHHNMGTSFSGTDTEQLKLAASTCPYYLSVVTNNKLEVTAKVAIESEIKWEAYSYHKNLFGKPIKGKKRTGTKKDYTIIECEVVLEKPEYMQSVDARIASKLQMYSHGGGIGKENYTQNSNTPKYTNPYTHNYNKSKYSDLDDYYSNKYGYSEHDWSGYQQKDNKTVGFQKSNLKTTHASVSSAVLNADDIKKIMKDYCLDSNYNLLPLDTCILAIIDDQKNYGVTLDDCLRVLKTYRVFTKLSDDDLLATAIKEFQKDYEQEKTNTQSEK